MAYTVFARKYRPQTFDALVGQQHVARTLAGAIEAGRVAHAFLFTGVRGVGKTTTARLLAKALCCEKGPTPTPCNVCDICVDITRGTDIDVQEIDGASNNGVDDVRRLQESLPFRPARDRFKIVIVDEVHMLSTGAFNAFLKTLEEPPDHVKFIFATTESHKVPVTIRSRCQRYDFRLIPQGVVADSVRRILQEEGVQTDEAAIGIVAREAAGSMRDALTLLDQLVAFSGDKLDGETVAAHLGIAARAAVHETTRALIEGDPAATLRSVDAALERSADPLHLAQQLLQYLRDVVVFRMTGPDTDMVDLVEEERAQLHALVAAREPMELQRAFSALAKLVDEVAHAASPRLVLEMGLTRIATRPSLAGVQALLQRLEALEEKLGAPPRGPAGGGPAGGGRGRPGGGRQGSGRGPSGPGRSAGAQEGARRPQADSGPSEGRVSSSEMSGPDGPGPSGPPTRMTDAPGRQDSTPSPAPVRSSGAGSSGPSSNGSMASSPAQSRPPESVSSQSKPAESTPMKGSEHGMMAGRGPTPERHPDRGRSQGGPRRPHTSTETPGRQDSPMGHAREHRTTAGPPQGGSDFRSQPMQGRQAPSQPSGSTTAHEPSPERGAPPQGPPSSASNAATAPIRRAALQEWSAFIEALREGRPALAAVLEHGVPRAVTPERIVLSFQKNSFYGRQADAPAAREAIAEVAQARLGTSPPLEIRFDLDVQGESSKTVAAVEAGRREAKQKQRKREALDHPVVRDAMQVFDASTGRVRVQLKD